MRAECLIIASVLIIILIVMIALLLKYTKVFSGLAAVVGGGISRKHAKTIHESVHEVAHSVQPSPADTALVQIQFDQTSKDEDKDEEKGTKEGGKGKSNTGRHWTAFETWESLKKDTQAHAEYMRDRARALNSLEFDWSKVLDQLRDKISSSVEYVGLINRVLPTESTENSLEVTALEASPIPKEIMKNDVGFASVPLKLFEKMANKPALFFFHTHPDDPRCGQMPSAADVSASITMGFAGRYAANVMVSKYGVFLYAPSFEAYKDVEDAGDRLLALTNYKKDVSAALDGIRSWRKWSLSDYEALFKQFKMILVVYPSSTYTAHSYLVRFRSLQDAPSYEDVLPHIRKQPDELLKIEKSTF